MSFRKFKKYLKMRNEISKADVRLFIALMKFIEYNEDIDKTTESAPNLEKIVDRVGQVKASEKVGVLCMQKQLTAKKKVQIIGLSFL